MTILICVHLPGGEVLEYDADVVEVKSYGFPVIITPIDGMIRLEDGCDDSDVAARKQRSRRGAAAT